MLLTLEQKGAKEAKNEGFGVSFHFFTLRSPHTHPQAPTRHATPLGKRTQNPDLLHKVLKDTP